MSIIYQIHPQHGYHMAVTSQEADANIKNGWKTVTEAEFYNTQVDGITDIKQVDGITDIKQVAETAAELNINDNNDGDEIPRAVLEELYEAKFGKKPPANAKDATIKAKLEDE